MGTSLSISLKRASCDVCLCAIDLQQSYKMYGRTLLCDERKAAVATGGMTQEWRQLKVLVQRRMEKLQHFVSIVCNDMKTSDGSRFDD